MNARLQEFTRKYPVYQRTRTIEDLRSSEFARLDAAGHVYLDYTGGGLFAERQLAAHHQLLRTTVFGNPHSGSPTSLASTTLVERARAYVLEYFNASPDEYVTIFTPNASGAMRVVGEAFPFKPSSRYVLTFDNHNAVNGVREFARAKGASITYVPVVAPELRIDEQKLKAELELRDTSVLNLFAYPAQSNFSGAQHPFTWVEYAQARGWQVILDAAAFVPTNRLDLSVVHPDFVPLSFYKMFGYPTGLGCLIAKKSALKSLHRPWFSGGTIEMASVQADKFQLAEGAPAFEDGTVDYLNIPAIEIGLRFLAEVGVETIHDRVQALTGWLLEELLALRHTNGRPLVEIDGPRSTEARGGTVAMNILDASGTPFPFRYVDDEAAKQNISIRTGCFCNPGAGEIAFHITREDMLSCFKVEERRSFEHCILVSRGKPAGAVRVSFGIASNFNDAERFVDFVKTFRDGVVREAAR